MQNIVSNLFRPEEALERLGQDIDLLKHLIFTFQSDFSRQKDCLLDAIGSKHLSQLKKELHCLKGSCAAVGAMGISESIRVMEEQLKLGKAGWDDAERLGWELLKNLVKVQDEFKAWLKD
ncbi:MAG: Hpt domain-containing protein [Burkholderiales bacterium]|nr:Hpt domain-containing protein [Burkholderiales bacterium]